MLNEFIYALICINELLQFKSEHLFNVLHENKGLQCIKES